MRFVHLISLVIFSVGCDRITQSTFTSTGTKEVNVLKEPSGLADPLPLRWDEEHTQKALTLQGEFREHRYDPQCESAAKTT
jgi:hypothetical protein